MLRDRVVGLGGLVVLTLFGCDARYGSLFPAESRPDAATNDAGANDTGPPPELGAGDQGQLTVLATGTWEGRSGYDASGSITLLQREDGTLELSFSPDFEVAGVPAPVVLLTTRPAVTNGVDEAAGDVSLGALGSNQGAQRYGVPQDAAGASYVFVYCLPFTVEVARAQLVPSP